MATNYDIVGTPLSFTYNGTSYRVKADVSIAENFRKFVTENVATSGDDLSKRTKQTTKLPGLALSLNQKERQTLDDDADSGPHKATYIDAAGFTVTGQANIGGDSSRTNDNGTYTCDVLFITKPTIINP